MLTFSQCNEVDTAFLYAAKQESNPLPEPSYTILRKEALTNWLFFIHK